MSKFKKIAIGVAAAIVVIILIVVFSPKAATSNNWVTEEVKSGPITLSVSASGNTNPENIYNVNARASAKVIEVNVKTGDIVKKGQQLAKLDDTDLQNALKSAQYSFNSAIYSRDQLKNLPVVDDYNVKKAQQQVNATSIQVQTAKNNLNNATIVAPTDGKVLAANIKVDEYTSLAAAVPAFIVGNSDKLQAYLNVNEVDIAKIQLDQEVNLTIDALSKTIPGKVVAIDENSTNIGGIVYYRVRTSISDLTMLKPGMSVDGEIVVTSKPSVLTVPSSALQSKGGMTVVRILSPESTEQNEIVLEKEVSVGINNNSLAEILAGLNIGEKVIINYNLKASSGSTISLPAPGSTN